MAVAQLSSTTLSAAIAIGDKNFTVASTTGISAGTTFLVVRNEVMKVQEVPVSGQVAVLRGYSGTFARAHPSGAVVYFGTADQFKAIQQLAAQNGLTGDSGNLPDYMVPGQRAFDGAGNEFIMVDLSVPCFSGTTVQISMDGLFSAAPVVGGGQGPVGLTIEEGTSAQYTWAQIYGFNSYAQDSTVTSAATSASLALAATSVSTPNVGLAVGAASSVGQFYIYGMFITGVATSTTTSASSATGVAVPVWLNYPYTSSVRGDISSL